MLVKQNPVLFNNKISGLKTQKGTTKDSERKQRLHQTGNSDCNEFGLINP